jgi:thiamine-phosphate pyrophosphorylase
LPAASSKPDAQPYRRPIVCYVTDRKSLGSAQSTAAPWEKLTEYICAAVDAGVDSIQIREKDLPAREMLDLTRTAVSAGAAAPRFARVTVNDRLDIALAAGAGGVHLGGESLPANEVVKWHGAGNVRREFPAGFLIGVSCHSLGEALAAERVGADYIFFGPVFATPSKLVFGPPQGVALLADVCGAVKIPTLAIGGVDENNAPECLRAGAAGIAAIRMFQRLQKPGELQELVTFLHNAGPS